jgi:hypothetical protein
MLEGIKKKADAAFMDAQLALARLKVIDPKTDNLLAAHQRHWRREHMLTHMDEKTRLEKVRNDPQWRFAALDDAAAPEQSGLPASLHEQMRDDYFRQNHPELLADHEATIEAHALTSRLFKACELALANELTAVGQSVVEPAPATPAEPSWV